tara:strand:- start:317 stop:532 length:216 start_codon:yes stop_codon:yes gene_type:complete
MAILRNKEIKELNVKQRNDKLRDLRKEMISIRSQIALGSTPENPGRTKEVKRTIARLITHIKNQKEGKKKA